MPLNTKYLKEWRKAGHEDRRGSQNVLPPAPAGFRRLYYLTSADHAVSNIVFSRIKVSRFSELNDPFELLGSNFSDVEFRKVVRQNKLKFGERNGLICFSEDWIDPVLWSHYANKHRGLALGFDVSESIVQQVTYSPSRLRYKPTGKVKSITGELATQLICTKFASWSYEKEWRALVELGRAEKEGSLYFLPFSDKLRLREVILGSACDINLKRFRKLINEAHEGVATFKARLALQSFQIIPMQSSVVGYREPARSANG
ncbi:DUF2971 domain-containing protein [Jiella endophytica]|uniref:DUF2971 domain-containing protein n=1 Tax=Jiella endophytica TaxID=2558362 RepID=A0A4Y8RII1_9HYPH|nr:DUF2971 domain-containing protein [Jiella endophytica]TFF21667.1 DUF2971 domain-containing protein [Jiella endophytica]